ncbi:hypothetical protein NGI46_21905 [Peribacillus butanolivorans]|uniref:hypothetical protein n=1 Tax=Peribacillus butanolivorans TaxID=421767 RepID=UPI00207C834D|nr:hypothetical protein [Peribacillus butanolivorans]MCO0600034.1 hypothetical protein [Peribacillus butanolivorans]
MKKFLNKIKIAGSILTIILMIFTFEIILFNKAFTEPEVDMKYYKMGHVEHRPNIWEGMSKEEYQKIKYLEEQKTFNYDLYEPELLDAEGNPIIEENVEY